MLVQGEKSLFFQGPQRTHGGPSEITQLLGGHLSHLAQDLHRLVLERCSPPPAGHLGQGLLRLHRQGYSLFQLVLYPWDSVRPADDTPRLRQAAQGRPRVRSVKGPLNLTEFRVASIGAQDVRQTHGRSILSSQLVQSLPVQSWSYAPALFQSVPEPGGEHHPDGLVHGAKVVLPHPQRQLDVLPSQYRLLVQYCLDGF